MRAPFSKAANVLVAVILAACSFAAPVVAGDLAGQRDEAVRERVSAALKAAKERRDRLSVRIESDAEAERKHELGDGRNDRGVRGAISDLLSQRDHLDRELAACSAELAALTEKHEAASQESRNATQRFKTFRREVQRIARETADRLDGTLLGLEKPSLAARARRAAESAGSDSAEDVVAAYRAVLDLFIEMQQDLSRVGVFELEIARTSGGGSVATRKVARIGDMIGYFSDPEGGGFVIRRRSDSGDSSSLFSGETRGLSSEDGRAINEFVADPGKSVFVPFDVTDGRGIAVAQSETSVSEWFAAGGVFMYPLTLIALMLVLLIAWRSVALLYKAISAEVATRAVINAVRAGAVDSGRAKAGAIRGPERRVLLAAFDHFNSARGDLEDAFNEAMLQAQPSFRRALSLISLGVAVAPMLGLLGTVTGMITTFKSLVVFGASDPANLAGGISEALITTEAGLMIAIPALLFRGILGAVAESSISSIEGRAMSLIIALRCAEPDSMAPMTRPAQAVRDVTGPGIADPIEEGLLRRKKNLSGGGAQ